MILTRGSRAESSPADLEQLEQVRTEMWEMVVPVIAERRAQPQNDAISRILEKQDEVGKEELSDDVFLNMLLELVAGGFETTQHLIEMMISHLADHPELWARLREDRSSCRRRSRRCSAGGAPSRHSAAVQPRTSSSTASRSRADSWVTVTYGSANRDEREFADPDSFDVDRDLRRHLAFSAGIHYCPGAPVSRAETKALLEELLDRYSTLERAGPSLPIAQPDAGQAREDPRLEPGPGSLRAVTSNPTEPSREPGPVGHEPTPEERLPHRRVRAAKLPQRVASAVVEEIASLDLETGDRLPSEAELAERFGVSRVSIREALRVLETFGVVRIKPGNKGGNVVGASDADDLARTLALFFRMARATYRDLMDARLVIEPFMARRAAERRHGEHLDELRGVMEREAASTAGTREGDQLALAFHWIICGASGNAVMDSLGRAIHTLYGDHLQPTCSTTRAAGRPPGRSTRRSAWRSSRATAAGRRS